MAMYAIGTKPLLDKLMSVVDKQICKQVWYADDSSAGGKMNEIKKSLRRKICLLNYILITAGFYWNIKLY